MGHAKWCCSTTWNWAQPIRFEILNLLPYGTHRCSQPCKFCSFLWLFCIPCEQFAVCKGHQTPLSFWLIGMASETTLTYMHIHFLNISLFSFGFTLTLVTLRPTCIFTLSETQTLFLSSFLFQTYPHPSTPLSCMHIHSQGHRLSFSLLFSSRLTLTLVTLYPTCTFTLSGTRTLFLHFQTYPQPSNPLNLHAYSLFSFSPLFQTFPHPSTCKHFI